MKILIILCLLLFISCGNRKDGQVRFSQLVTINNLNGGVVVYAFDGAEHRTYVFNNGTQFQNTNIEFPNNSTWDFRIVSWEGTNGKFTGIVRCEFLSAIKVGNGQQAITANLTNPKCLENNSTLAGSAYHQLVNGKQQFLPLNLIGCGDFDDGSGSTAEVTNVSNASSFCTSQLSMQGISTHYKFKIVSNHPANQYGVSEISSGCIEANPSTGTNIALNLPIGFNDSVGFKYRIEAYSDHRENEVACTGEKRTIHLGNGIADTGKYKINALYALDVVGVASDGSQIKMAFADNIGGRGLSPLRNLIPTLTLGTLPSTTAILPPTDPVAAKNFIVMESATTNVFFKGGANCNITNTSVLNTNVTWALTPTLNSTDNNSCKLELNSQSTSSFIETLVSDPHLNFTSTIDGISQSYLIWLASGTGHEFRARENLYEFIGNPELNKIKSIYDGQGSDDGNRKVDSRFLEAVRDLKANGIGSILAALYPEATNCATLPGDGPPRQVFYDFGQGGLSTVEITIEDPNAGFASIPAFIRKNDNPSGIGASDIVFSKKISLKLGNELSKVIYIECNRKVGMSFDSEIDGNEYRKNLALWNTENSSHQRFEIYQEEVSNDSYGGGSYTRLVKPNDAGKYTLWSYGYKTNSGTVEGANEFVAYGESGSAFPVSYYTNDYDGTLSGYNWQNATIANSFITAASGSSLCANLATMQQSAFTPVCSNTFINLSGNSGNNHNGTFYSPPFFGLEESIKLDTITVNKLIPTTFDINSF